MSADHSEDVRRAALPELMFVPDLTAALQLGPQATRRAVLRGEVGPYLRIGNRLAVLRESFLAALTRRQTLPIAMGAERTLNG